MAFPVIVYDPSGSNTAASGAGPATALTGTNATVSGQVITLDGSPDLSGVAGDGSHVIYFESTDSSANRRLFKITAVDDGAKTVTVDGTIVGTGVNWAIGGKRLNFENSSRRDWADWDSGWDVSIEGDTSVILLTEGINITAGDRTDGPVTVRGLVGSKQTLDVTSNIRHFTVSSAGANIVIKNLDFTRSSGSWIGNYGVYVTASANVSVQNCTYNSANMQDGVHITGTAGFSIEDCEMSLMNRHGIYVAGGRAAMCIRRNVTHDLGDDGINIDTASTFAHAVIERNESYDNAGSGIRSGITAIANASIYIIDNICDRNNVDGIEIVGAPHAQAVVQLEGNILTSNVVNGVNFPSSSVGLAQLNRNNWYYNNGTDRNNLEAGENDGSGDPLFRSVVDGAEDYRLQSNSPCRNAGSSQRSS